MTEETEKINETEEYADEEEYEPDCEETETETETDEDGECEDAAGEECGQTDVPDPDYRKRSVAWVKFKMKCAEKIKRVGASISERAEARAERRENNPPDPHSLAGKWDRWVKVTFKGYAYLWVMWYDKERDEYRLDIDIKEKGKIPLDAVHVTGKKNTYHLDLDLTRRGFSSYPDCGFTAVDAYLYMRCNKIEQAMRINMDKPNGGLDMNKLMLYLALAAGGIFAIVYLMKSGMLG